MASKSFIQSLPKAELHLHLEGSVDPATLAELSRRYNTPLPTENNRYDVAGSGDVLTEDDVRRLYSYKDSNGFLMAFKSVTERLRSPEDYELVTYRLMQKLRQQNVVHAEVYVSVGVIRWRGQPVEPIFEGMERGRERGQRGFGVSLLWIFDAVRHFGPQAASEVFDLEARGPAEGFRDLYKKAADNGLRLTAHAGETTGPESIWGALNIGAERIGHGLSAAKDPELLEVMAQKQVPVEMCITSNLRTGACKEMQEHPVKKFFDQGLMITLSTDDPAMFQTSLNKEFEIAQQEFSFTEDHLRELARNSIEASFLPVEKKLRFMQQIDFLA
jgi:aminodeoxyfutalosine deaminase